MKDQAPIIIMNNAIIAMSSIGKSLTRIIKTPFDKALLALEFDPNQLSRSFTGKFEYLDRGKVIFAVIASLLFEVILFDSFLIFLLFNVIIITLALYRRQLLSTSFSGLLESDKSKVLFKEAAKTLLLEEALFSDIKLRALKFLTSEKHHDGMTLLQLYMDLNDTISKTQIEHEPKLKQFNDIFDKNDLALLSTAGLISHNISKADNHDEKDQEHNQPEYPTLQESQDREIPLESEFIETDSNPLVEEEPYINKTVQEVVHEQSEKDENIQDSEKTNSDTANFIANKEGSEKQAVVDKDVVKSNLIIEEDKVEQVNEKSDESPISNKDRPRDIFDEEESDNLPDIDIDIDNETTDFVDIDDLELPDLGDNSLPEFNNLDTETPSELDDVYDIQEEDYL